MYNIKIDPMNMTFTNGNGQLSICVKLFTSKIRVVWVATHFP